ncbi:MAG: ATP-dependent zinc metalloprotease FtsH [Candidatus Saccharibacteria bacterium]|nr:ATP-dependent zinc metalloprotease FtsH [Candidatus Saccharibacteria bacterium]MCY4088797.1 ATP-dependent zinc metalloprotease FtsH [Candidatus Saccharibacteria bacterium]
MKPQRINKPKSQRRKIKNILWVILVVSIILLLIQISPNDSDPEEISLTEFNTQLSQTPTKIKKIIIKAERIDIYDDLDEEADPIAYTIRDSKDITLEEQGVHVPSSIERFNETDDEGAAAWVGIITSLVISAGIIFVLIFLFKSAQGQGSQALSFGRSKARLYGNDAKSISFKDIAGNDHAKEDLEEVVDFLKHPVKFKNVGAKMPKGVLLVGPPGTGKTMIARAVAGEAKVPFYNMSGSEFVEMFVGVGASRVRDSFAKAKKNAPCILFIDEIDAVGRRRGSGMGGGHDEREQTLNQILVEMDGFEQEENVIVLAATNRADVLDPALLRPGRFDRRVNISLPDRKDRQAILEIYFKDKPLADDIDIKALAAKTAGSSGADLSNIVNESAIRAARRNSKQIADRDVVEAFEKVAIGPARKNNFMSDKEKELTAYHEAGHAIVGFVLPHSDEVHKVTIVSRGHAGGVTWFLPPDDKSYHSILEFKDVLARMLGGRVAEKVIYGSEAVTTGAGSDLQKATELARDMIMNQGMGSNDLRDQVFHTEEGLMFDRMMHEKLYSEKTADRIDQEILGLIKEAAYRAEIIIKANLHCIEKLKDALLDKETVEAEEIKTVFNDARLPREVKLPRLATPH